MPALQLSRRVVPAVNGPPRHRAVVTFLFTDIEGSTRRWEADAEAMRAARWRLTTRCCVRRSRRTTARSSTTPATGCAPYSPLRVRPSTPQSQRRRTLELPVRMGIATGEAELRGDDYFGTVLNRTARVMAAGHGGQILLDGTTAGLIGGVNLISLGNRSGCATSPNQWMFFRSKPRDCASSSRRLKTVDPTPGNLRPRHTTFIGREAEIIEVEELLESPPIGDTHRGRRVGRRGLALEVADGGRRLPRRRLRDRAGCR